MSPTVDLAAVTERYKRARERYMVLSECLTITEATKRRFSRNEAAQVPKEGYEKPFDEEQRRVEVLQEMLRELRLEIETSGRVLGM